LRVFASLLFPSLKQKIPLRHRQYFRRLAREHASVGLDRVGLGIDFDLWQRVVEHHVALADFPATLHQLEAAWETQVSEPSLAQRRFADEREARRVPRPARRPELRPIERRLRRRNRSVGIAHVCPRDETALQHSLGFYPEERRFEDDDVRELADL